MGAGLSGIDFKGTVPKNNRLVRQVCFVSDDRKVGGGGGVVGIFRQDCFLEGQGQVCPALPVHDLGLLGSRCRVVGVCFGGRLKERLDLVDCADDGPGETEVSLAGCVGPEADRASGTGLGCGVCCAGDGMVGACRMIDSAAFGLESLPALFSSSRWMPRQTRCLLRSGRKKSECRDQSVRVARTGP